jgi:hypothetical protein
LVCVLRQGVRRVSVDEKWEHSSTARRRPRAKADGHVRETERGF